MNDITFDATTVEPNQRPDPVPAGDYIAMIVASTIEPTRDATGQILKLELQILQGEYKGRKVWDNLNILNKSEKAQSIAQSQLSSICRAVGQLQLKNTTQLHDKPVKVRVTVTQDVGYEAKNEVKRYSPVEGGPAVVVGSTGAQPAAAAAQPSASAPSWARKAS